MISGVYFIIMQPLLIFNARCFFVALLINVLLKIRQRAIPVHVACVKQGDTRSKNNTCACALALSVCAHIASKARQLTFQYFNQNFLTALLDMLTL